MESNGQTKVGRYSVQKRNEKKTKASHLETFRLFSIKLYNGIKRANKKWADIVFRREKRKRPKQVIWWEAENGKSRWPDETLEQYRATVDSCKKENTRHAQKEFQEEAKFLFTETSHIKSTKVGICLKGFFLALHFFLATLKALHSAPVSRSVGGQAEF